MHGGAIEFDIKTSGRSETLDFGCGIKSEHERGTVLAAAIKEALVTGNATIWNKNEKFVVAGRAITSTRAASAPRKVRW